MAYPSVSQGDKILHTMVGSLCGQTVMSTFSYLIVDQNIPGAVTMDDFAVFLDNHLSGPGALQTVYLDCAPTNYTLVETWYQWVEAGALGQRYSAIKIPVGAVGTSAHAANTANLAATITRRGVFGTRNAVSTLHVPISGHSDNVDGGLLTNAFKIVVNILAQQTYGNFNVATGGGPIFELTPIINHGLGANNFTTLEAAFAMPQARVMRRRTVGLGI